jgi:hypothetical protein
VLRAFAGSFVLPGDAPSSACLHSAGRCPCPKPFETAVKSFFFVYGFDRFSVYFRFLCSFALSFYLKFSAVFVLVPQNCIPPPENSAFCFDILHGTALYLCHKETPGMKMHGYVFFCPEVPGFAGFWYRSR